MNGEGPRRGRGGGGRAGGAKVSQGALGSSAGISEPCCGIESALTWFQNDEKSVGVGRIVSKGARRGDSKKEKPERSTHGT